MTVAEEGDGVVVTSSVARDKDEDADEDEDEDTHHWFPQHSQEDPDPYDLPTTSTRSTGAHTGSTHPATHGPMQRQSSELTHVVSNRTATIATTTIATMMTMPPPPPRIPPPFLQDNDISKECCTTGNGEPLLQYYRVVFQGVVAILSMSLNGATITETIGSFGSIGNNSQHHLERTGEYVSYGEIIAGRPVQLPVSSIHNRTWDNHTNQLQPQPHPQTVIQIHAILTGGYAVDAETTHHCRHTMTTTTAATTTISNNTKFDTSVTTTNTDSSFTNDNENDAASPDYKRVKNTTTAVTTDRIVYMEQDAVQIVEPIATNRLPQIEQGTFFTYRVISATPIPILTGPHVQAPAVTNSFLLPGTILQVSARVTYHTHSNDDDDNNSSDQGTITFLRLLFRRGWIADRKITPLLMSLPTDRHSTTNDRMVVQEITTNTEALSRSTGDGHSSSSIATGSVNSGTTRLSSSLAPSTNTSLWSVAMTQPAHRHRPPRRRPDAATGSTMISSKTSTSSSSIHHRSMDSDKMMILPRHIMETKSLKKGITNDPSSNVSILSDDSSHATHQSNITTNSKLMTTRDASAPASPNVSVSTTTNNKSFSSHCRNGHTNPNHNNNTNAGGVTTTTYFLMRVLAPKGLKILDAPQFQVNRLIRNGKSQSSQNVAAASSHLVSQVEPISRTHNSIFQTMSSRFTTTGKNTATGNVPVFDYQSKTRILPCGALFESSRRMETTGSYNQGAGLIKLSDQSGWAIVPRQAELDQQYRDCHDHKMTKIANPPNEPHGIKDTTKSYEEVGRAIVDMQAHHPITFCSKGRRTEWIQVMTRAGIPVSSPPPLITQQQQQQFDQNYHLTSPSLSSRESSAVVNSSNNVYNGSNSSNQNVYPSNDSDVASSVGSAFLDALFRTPQKKNPKDGKEVNTSHRNRSEKTAAIVPQSTVVPCGMFVEVERPDDSLTSGVREFARICGGQGWVPLIVENKTTTRTLPCRPMFRYGSIWFRVQATRGIKVRFGPSNRSSSIKSEDGEYFRFECGEFLRASETITSFSEKGEPVESFAKLYRNRHVQLHPTHDDFRSLQSLTIEAEWVQIHNDTELFLEECLTEPRMERHKQGWRYNVMPDDGIAIRKGPSFAAERTGVLLFGGENVVINERVTPAGDHMSWLRLKDGQGWIHDYDENGEQIVVLHSLRHRAMSSRARKLETTPVAGNSNDIPYNAIISRLFHNDGSQRPTER